MVYSITILSVAIVLCSFYTSRIEGTRLSLVVTTCSSDDITLPHPFFFILINDISRKLLTFGQNNPLNYSNNKDYDLKADTEGDICSDSLCAPILHVVDIYGTRRKLPYESVTIHESYNSSYKFKYVSNLTTCREWYDIHYGDIDILCSDPKFTTDPREFPRRPTCLPKKCPPSKYGRICEHDCTRCQNGQCERNGACVVKVCAHVSHTGIKCDTTCRNGHWGLTFKTTNNVSRQLEVCQHRCFCRFDAQCNGIDGTCPGGLCEAGYKIGCQEKCPPRMWSSDNVNCDKKCECEQDEDCYHDGICPHGPKILCRNFLSDYGPNCTKQCHCINREICNNITGHCINGCDLQHYGNDCQQVCTAGRYHMVNEPADLCSGRCYCRNNQNCNATNGHCYNGCEVDYWGHACERECKYGPNCVYGKPCHCLGGNDKCDNETGCIECSNRWMGQDCQTTCKNNFWGPAACRNPCHCAQPGDCRVADGECRGPCPARRYGKRCENDCKDDKTGNILCIKKRCHCLDEDSDCNSISLKCRGGCDIRYTGGYGTKCVKKCRDGQYIDRSRKCSGKCHCLNKNLCNVTGGACVGDGGCHVGWVEPTCLHECIFGGQGCKKSCNCFKNSVCHPITGTCPNGLCELRYYGTDCQRKCPDDYFLETGSCKGICHCANRGQCRATDGECMDGVCGTGWEGDYCQTQCNYGLPSAECREICHCKGGHPCERVTGYCPEGCDTRYHGPGCTLECPINQFLSSKTERCTNDCHCLNPNKCNATSGVCTSGGCESGYKGSDCQTKCVKGRFGKNCQKYCHCDPPDDCNIKSGLCMKCYPRYIGYNCQRTCPDATYLIKGKCDGQCHCNDITKCRLVNGECLDGVCTPGWESGSRPSGKSDRMCNIPCQNSMWGKNCEMKCHCRTNTPCNHTNGYCDVGCDTRWYYHPACNKTCDTEKYLDQFGKCTRDCECVEQKYCRVEHGVCEQGGCKSGAQAGSTCLEPCKKGTYRLAPGKTCTETCHCSGGLPCDDIGGYCPSGCHHRYRGLRCNATCASGSFYDAMSGVCSGVCHCSNVTSCHVDDGKCSSGGCEDGYVGPSCQKPCSQNRYGHKCQLHCQCLNDAKCNHISGECPGRTCNNRHEGRNCNIEICPIHRYRKKGKCDGECYCLNSRDCDAKTGSCGGSRCVAGRRGDRCQYTCRLKFGDNCEKRCHCFENRQCDIKTGACPIGGCDIRHTGVGCQKGCPAGRYNPAGGCNKRCRCDKNKDCHIIDGYCRGGLCQESRGLRFFGVDCQSRCNVGRYVFNGTCSGECRCAVPEQCSVLNGSCNGGQCKPGWLGDKCSQECEDGKFGPKCSKKCRCKFEKPCEKDYGKCADGCDEGWSGDNCQWREDESQMFLQIGIYGGSIIGICVIAAMFGYCAIALRKRRRQQVIMELKEYLANGGETSHISLVSHRRLSSEVHNPPKSEWSRRRSRVSISRNESFAARRLSSTTGRKIRDGDSVHNTHADYLSEIQSKMSRETQPDPNIQAWSTTSMGSMRRSKDAHKSISHDGRSGLPWKSSKAASSQGSKASMKSKNSLDIKASRKSHDGQVTEANEKVTRDHHYRRKRRRKTSKAGHEGKETKRSKTSHDSKMTIKSKTSMESKVDKKSKTSQLSHESKKSKTSQHSQE